ncbi:MAG: serine acetyltransferase [Prevotellaceae bacterium]|jgi:serine O-acetyltransferase|nr:serine acetyltransferase [Prevotellaceae bacterium]
MKEIEKILKKNIAILQKQESDEYQYIPKPARMMPSVENIREIIEIIKSIVFPGFFGETEICDGAQEYHLGMNMEKLYKCLNMQINTALCFSGKQEEHRESENLTLAFIDTLPEIKRMLATDIKAVCDGDPAATGYDEVIYCYPAIQAILNYRVAHELLLADIPLLPRIISELAHSATGIDIHPGASIGEYFSIDHGTGVVIGETCVIGNHVRLYQGVTLGARSLATNEEGVVQRYPRHPILEDNVIVYSNSTILGRITIGHDTIIGGNIWQVYGVPPFSRIVQKKAVASSFIDGLGI